MIVSMKEKMHYDSLECMVRRGRVLFRVRQNYICQPAFTT